MSLNCARGLARRLGPVLAVLAFGLASTGLAGAGTTHATAVRAPPDFGPNVKIFDPSMSTSQIKAAVDAIEAQQVDNEFGNERYALLFKPGSYGTPAEPLNFRVGYYTQVAGLGSSPSDVDVNGTI